MVLMIAREETMRKREGGRELEDTRLSRTDAVFPQAATTAVANSATLPSITLHPHENSVPTGDYDQSDSNTVKVGYYR